MSIFLMLRVFLIIFGVIGSLLIIAIGYIGYRADKRLMELLIEMMPKDESPVNIKMERLK